MRSNVLKVSALAATIAASFGAQAAVYTIVPHNTAASGTTHGVAITPNNTDNCWTGSCSAATADLAVETRPKLAGFSYREEVPFIINTGYDYLEDVTATQYDGFKNYCDVYLRYQSDLCDSWARERWNGYKKELADDFTNSLVFVENGVDLGYSENAIVNELDDGAGKYVGNRRNGTTNRNLAYYGSTDLTATGLSSTHAWRSLVDSSDIYVVGSVTKNSAHDANDKISQAVVWKLTSAGAISETNVIPWGAEGESAASDENKREKPHASARDIVKIGAEFYAVGYNSDVDEKPFASVFNSTDGTTWKTRRVSFPRDEDALTNYYLQAVNDNKIAVGTYKLNESLNGAYANGLFYVADVTATSPSSTNLTGGIFFEGANGKVGNINNKNELVGQVDYETHAENNGKPRAQRGFITVLGDKSLSSAPFKNTAYLLDDLTNDGSGANNAYRVYDATDINEAGVISATAYYCAGGYDTEAVDSTCNGGQPGSEKLVAVKLVPDSTKTAADITPRPRDRVNATVERQGASLGWFALGLLGLLGFRRK